jgi:hypothetical protein
MRPRWRAYILLETLVAGGIVSIALATSVTIIAAARFETSLSTRRAEASALALGIADGLMSSSTATSQPLTDVPNHPGLKASFTITSSSALQTASVPALAQADGVEEITVVVEYPTTRTRETLTYQRLRRKVRP